ncbi:MAG: 2Fe-2S iron-sulfur cluster-binding protein, partial [Rhizobiaceae bacterium]
SRADLAEIFADAPKATHVYTCGPDHYMQAVMDAAKDNGIAEENRHLEYFSVPEIPEYENHDFTLSLIKSGKQLLIPADQSATDVLAANGVHLDVKCSDGLCGVCKCGLVSGEVEHRDFVLSAKQREHEVILCQSRAAHKNGVLEVDL